MRIFINCILLVILFLCIVLGEDANQAQANNKVWQKKADADTALISHLAQEPQLMNTSYLDCYLGENDGSSNIAMARPGHSQSPTTVTVWHDLEGHFGAYKLASSLYNPSTYFAEFSAPISTAAQLRLKDIDKLLKLSSSQAFDEQGKPVYLYQTRPDTQVLVYQAPGVADINKIRVCYEGAVLPPPSATDMQEALQYRRDEALSAQKMGNHQQAAHLFQAHLRSNPNDAEAHLKLAESYKAQCRINDAIKEYRIALDHCGNDDQLHQQCIDGLHSLQVDLPAEAGSSMPSPTTPGIKPTGPTLPPPVLQRERININPPSTPNIKTGNPIANIDVGF
jgi:tetratricopeptide (TPR) repeat protein